MPLYEYLCDPCEEQFQALRPMSCSEEGAACPICRGASHRIPSLFAAFSTGEEARATAVAGTGGCLGCASGACSC